jgi:hypothetical protein
MNTYIKDIVTAIAWVIVITFIMILSNTVGIAKDKSCLVALKADAPQYFNDTYKIENFSRSASANKCFVRISKLIKGNESDHIYLPDTIDTTSKPIDAVFCLKDEKGNKLPCN